MTPRQVDPLPRLEGLGVNVRLAIPGHAITTTDGRRRWLLEDLVVEETPAGDYALLDPELPDPVVIPAADVIHAAAQVANLILAVRHDARAAARVLDDAIATALTQEATP